MLITKFNKLIRNKVVWGIFAVIVGGSFAFGGLISKWGRKTDNRNTQNAAGELFGNNIESREFFTAKYYEMGLRSDAGLTPEQNTVLRERTWKRLAAVQSAENIGLSVSDTEVASTIQQDPTFQDNGIFNKEKYISLISSQLRVPISTFENYMRQELLIRKIMQVMQSMAWVSPSELTKRLDDISDAFVIETATITTPQLTDPIKISVDDAKIFFTENEELFRIPEKISVNYISIAISNHLAYVEVTDELISEYYDKNLEDYASTNALEDPTPLAEVRDDITTILSDKQSIFLARDAATDIVLAMAPDRYKKGMSMKEVAENKNLTIHSTGLFSEHEPVPGISANGKFNKAAFKLDKNDPDSSFSDPITGQDAIYVIAIKEQVASVIPSFDEVKDKVMVAATQGAKEKAVIKKAKEIYDTVRTEIKDETTFTIAMQKYNVNVSTSETFSVYESSQDNSPIAPQLIQHIMVLPQGSITEPIPTMLGATIAYIASREHSDITTTQLLRPQLMSTISKYRANLIYSDWGDYILAKADFKDFAANLYEEEEEEEE